MGNKQPRSRPRPAPHSAPSGAVRVRGPQLQVNAPPQVGQLGFAEFESRVFTGHNADAVYGCAVSSNGLQMASASHDQTVKIWDQRGAELMTLMGHCGSVRSCHFSMDDRVLVSGSEDKTCILWDLLTGQKVHTFVGHLDRVYCCRFSHRGNQFASVSHDKSFRLWDPRTHRCVSLAAGQSSPLRGVAFHPNDVHLATASHDKKIRIWDIRMPVWTPIQTLSGHTESVWSCEFSPDGSQLVSASLDRTVRLWPVVASAQPRRQQHLWAFGGHSAAVHHATFALNGQCIVSASSDNTLKVWSTGYGVCLRTLRGHSNDVYDVMARGNMVVSASADKTVRLWNVPFEKLLVQQQQQPDPQQQTNVITATELEEQRRVLGVTLMPRTAEAPQPPAPVEMPQRNELNPVDLAERLQTVLRLMPDQEGQPQERPEQAGLHQRGGGGGTQSDSDADPGIVAEIALDVGECVICYDRAPDTTLLPCRHMCLCGECARTWNPATPHNNCPICRQPFDRFVHDTRTKEAGRLHT